LELVGDQVRKSGMKTVVLVNPLTAVVHLEPTSQIEPCTLGFSETNQNPLERRYKYIYIYINQYFIRKVLNEARIHS